MNTVKSFRLKVVGDIREIHENQAKVAFASALQDVQNAEAKLRNDIDAISQSQEWRGGMSKQGATDTSMLFAAVQYEQYCENLAHQHQQEVTSLVEVANAKRDQLIEATKKRKVIDKLRDKHNQAVRVANQREENKMLEEMATVSYIQARDKVN